MPETTGTTAAAPKPADRAVPVGLNEAALDSPSFRAMAAHFADQVDAVEKWLNGYVSSTSKLMQGVSALEDTINSVLSKTTPFPDNVIDNDYTLLALRRIGEGQRDFWMQVLASSKRLEYSVVEPIRSFLLGELRNFKEIRRVLEQSQRSYDSALARYVAQSKTKEPSALREDAFAVYESRKQYIVASMDYCQLAPQFRFSLDQLLVKVCCDIQKELNRSREAATAATKWGNEIDRVRGWAKEMELSDGVFKRELQHARQNLSELAFEQFKPSRELEDYSSSTVPFLSSRGPVSVAPQDDAAAVSEKQGWLFLRTATTKPVRYTWVRRWYYCRDGVFGWLMSAPQGVLQGDEIGVLLCNVKPAAGEERRFCFELKTKSKSMLLQAETQKELTAWLEVFEIAKKKAFEATMERDNNNNSAPGVDPAFSISPPSIPEFSVKVADAQSTSEEPAGASERGSALTVAAAEGARASFDPNGSVSRRSFTTLAREEGESGREHAARIIQKLDLHRRATFGANQENALSSSASSGALSGIVSPAQTTAVQSQGILTSHMKQSAGPMLSLESKACSLAPPTLARPPTCTQLSRTAVLVAGERGHVLDGKKLPTSVVANYWGSTIWATVHAQEQPGAQDRDDDDPIGVVMSEGAQTSLTDAALSKRTVDALPATYPAELRIQHAQFRLLFPNAPPEERLVLVFRAAWSSSLERGAKSEKSELLAGDGRVYVTPENMYFYSQQLGLVTAYSISLDIIKEVTAAAGRDCDFIFLHLGQETNDTGFTRIAIKVFLDDLQLLQARLNLLVDNLQAEEPLETLDIINALLSTDRAEPEKSSPSVESWEDVSSGTPLDDGAAAAASSLGRIAEKNNNHLIDLPRLPVPGLKLPTKLNLPQHPVHYEPDDMTEMAAERHYEISAKACFHVLFGDKSFVFPKLYFEHRAKQIAQGPWTMGDQGAPRSREFHFKIDYVDVLGRSKTAQIRDIQTVDVFNDHTTYVVTHTKTAWHLPHSDFMKLVTKVVITHQAKSKCKLAIYVRVDWSKSPFLSKSLVDRQALRDVACDAEELAELTTDQIHKLGSKSRTSRAIQVYGHVGQQTQVVVFSPALTESRKKQAIKPRTLAAMLFETALSFGESVVSTVIMWIFAGLKKLYDVVSAHWLLIFMLGLSVAANLMLSTAETWTWWQERRAVNMMRRIGVGPDQMMSKAIYVADLAEAAGGDGREPLLHHNSTCFGTFQEMLDMTSMDASWEEAGASLTVPQTRSAARRLRRTRQRLGTYRHELLVAMRVVNNLEREMMQSEWENWLANEQSHCEDLDRALDAHGDPPLRDASGLPASSGSRILGSMTEDRRQALEAWRDDYCGSCRTDHEAVMRARRLASM
ncbi:putative PH domain-containing protein [Escovopsis weberi]|uniref:Putative PH domain-containing protein n=1 Tax=Escovopsis weberi TaxID=150374 RepID=A0A0M8MY86_ESCWE|nr:putative PH domain-containing protein [Escovopsis weberi]